MANRTVSITCDHTIPTRTIDLAPQPLDMELSFAEIEVFQGDSLSIQFQINQNSQPFNLTGYSVLFVASPSPGFPGTGLILSETAVVSNPTTGLAQVNLTGLDLVTPGNYTAQLYITSNGTTQTVFQSPLVIQPSV